MGVASSRKVLCVSSQPPESSRNSKRDLKPFSTADRLVRNKLRKEVQCGVHDEESEIRDSIPIVQKPPESLQ